MRPVPHLIDNSSRIGETMIIFVTPLFLLRTIDPLLGLFAAAACAAAYVRFTFGKPDGTLLHAAYRAGIPLSGLLDRRIRRLLP
jgi:hypothetical protein